MHVDKAAFPGSPAPRVASPLDVVVDGWAGVDVVVVGDVVVGDVMKDVVGDVVGDVVEPTGTST
jgi:hypothetical protein